MDVSAENLIRYFTLFTFEERNCCVPVTWSVVMVEHIFLEVFAICAAFMCALFFLRAERFAMALSFCVSGFVDLQHSHATRKRDEH